MQNLSIRLPEDIERRLDEEARVSGRSRSEVARDAIAEFLDRRTRERFMSEFVAEAQALYLDEAARRRAVELADEALTADNEVLDSLGDDAERWWK